ncbi:MAG: hypothetical protein EXS12_03135 [Phycisphaerales bacterium]|nr:hypothetical protein [Phycisphaerales bacterium]
MPRQRTFSLILTSIASLVCRFTGLATQIVMAWFLTPDDYGLYAIALGILAFTTVMRGGGTGVVFQTMKLSEFATIGGGLVRVAMGCGILGTIFTLAMVLPAPYLYPQDSTKGLGWILFWSAVGFLIFNFTTYPRAKVLSRLLFNHIAYMDILGALAKLASAYYFAANGYGALSFVLSQLIGGIVILAWSMAIAGLERADFKSQPQWITETFTMMKIPFVMAMITSLGSQTDLFVASFFMPVGALGIYLFTNQLAVQPIQMLSSTLQSVLSPYAARVRGDIDQEDLSVRQTFITGVIFVPLFIMGIAAVYPSLAHLLFAQKWDESILPVQFACAFLIYPTVQTLLEAPLMGARRWPVVLELFTGRMIGKIAGAVLGIGVIVASRWVAPIPETYFALTLVISVGMICTVIAFFQIKKVSKQIHVSDITFRYEMYSTPAYAVLAAIATSSLASSAIDLFEINSASIRNQAFFEFLFCLLSYSSVCVLLLRFGYVDNLNNLLQLLPQNMRKHIYKALVLEEKSASTFQNDA